MNPNEIPICYKCNFMAAIEIARNDEPEYFLVCQKLYDWFLNCSECNDFAEIKQNKDCLQ